MTTQPVTHHPSPRWRFHLPHRERPRTSEEFAAAHHRRLVLLGGIAAVIGAVWITAMIGLIVSAQAPADDYVRVHQSKVTAGFMALALADAVAAMVCIIAIAYESQLRTTRRLLGRHPPDKPS